VCSSDLRDYVEISNLQRQTLFDERDAAAETPKAVAACSALSKVNSEVELAPVVADVNSGNIEALVNDVDIVLDGSDNMELRYLMNEVCHKLQKPWIYGGVIGSAGTSMNVLWKGGPCFRCLAPDTPPPGSSPTCSTAGALNMAAGIIASLESAEALKYLTGSPDVSRRVFFLDVWDNTAEYIEAEKDPDCPVCSRGKYEFFGRASGARAAVLCGRDAYQITPEKKSAIDFERLACRLKETGEVSGSEFMLSYKDSKVSFNLFPDGRAIIKQVKSEGAAKSVYAEYIGI
jgi:adenylyltransferase/sulfurtransferase